MSKDFESRFLISRALPPEKIEFVHDEKHLIFRPFSPHDVEKFERSLSITLSSLYKYMPWPVKDWNYKECLIWLSKRHGDYYSGKEYEWGCFDGKTGDFLLTIGIMPVASINPNVWEVGFWTSIKYTNKGLATLATQIIIAISFKCFHITRLQVGVAKKNKASIRVIEKCGFQFEGELRGLFPSPSQEQIKRGAIDCQFDYLFAILPRDCETLKWFSFILNSTFVTSLEGKTYNLINLK